MKYQKLIFIILLILSIFGATYGYADCPAASYYTIYYGTAPWGYSNTISGITSTSYSFTSMPEGMYYFATTATNSYGESNYSNEVSSYVSGTVMLSWEPPATCMDGSLIDSSGFAVTTVLTGRASDGNGAVLCTIPLSAGDNATCSVIPNEGYSVSSIMSNCGGTLRANTFETGPLTSECTVSFTFAINDLIWTD